MNHKITSGMAARTLLLVALSTAPMFAQGILTETAAAVSADLTSAVQIIAGVVVIGMALWILVSHSHGVIGRVITTILGLYAALNAQQVAGWIHSL